MRPSPSKQVKNLFRTYFIFKINIKINLVEDKRSKIPKVGVPEKLKNYNLAKKLKNRKNLFDLKNRLTIGKHVWIVGIFLGLVATTLTVIYTYEAISLQRRKGFYLNL